MQAFFTVTTRGLEAVSADEIAALPGVTVTRTSYRRITGVCAGPLDVMLTLRTVDDAFLDLATWSDVGRPRSALAALRVRSAQLDLCDAAATVNTLRLIGAPPTFSVTASFVGKRNYSYQEIKQAVAEGIETSQNWVFQPDDRAADINIRIFIEHDEAFVGMRLSKAPLHERPYKQAHHAGSLKPSVAAALLFLAGAAPGIHLLDPFCGAGTILVEAALLGADAQGGDYDPSAVAMTRLNADTAGVPARVERWDAQALPIATASVDRVVSNLPWGRQVVVDTSLPTLYQRACEEMERVLVPNGCIVLLTSTAHLLKFSHLQPTIQIEISLFGQTPMITVLSLPKSTPTSAYTHSSIH